MSLRGAVSSLSWRSGQGDEAIPIKRLIHRLKIHRLKADCFAKERLAMTPEKVFS
jgi:hypothetical protein